jgi:hypothetical protein
MTVEYVPTTNLANILQGAPQTSALIVLDQDGNPQPVVFAFQAMNGTAASGGSHYLNLSDNGVNGGWYDQGGTTLQDDPARIILSPAQPETFDNGDPNNYFPGPENARPFTVVSLLAAFGPVSGEGDGLISGPNEGDVPTNTGSPVALVQRIPTPMSPPVLMLVHGVYVDHERNRTLLSAF